MKQKRLLGIVGGVGPRATADFYLKFCELHSEAFYPRLRLHNLELRKDFAQAMYGEGGLVNAAAIDHMREMLIEAIKNLISQECSLIATPCNTLQPIVEDLSTLLRFENVSPIKATLLESLDKKAKEVFLISTSRTYDSMIYHDLLERQGMTVLPMSKSTAHIVHRQVESIVNSRNEVINPLNLNTLPELQGRRPLVILGCTDLRKSDFYNQDGFEMVSSVEAQASLAFSLCSKPSIDLKEAA